MLQPRLANALPYVCSEQIAPTFFCSNEVLTSGHSRASIMVNIRKQSRNTLSSESIRTVKAYQSVNNSVQDTQELTSSTTSHIRHIRERMSVGGYERFCMKIRRQQVRSVPFLLGLVLGSFTSTALAASLTSSVQASSPSAATIMQRVDQVAKRVVIAHGVGTSVVATSTHTKSGTNTSTEYGWFSGNATTNGSQRSLIREKLELRTGSQTKIRTIEYATRSGLLAERVSGTTGWLCGPVGELNTILVWTPDSFQFTLPKKPAQSWVAGSTRFQGADVWKLNYTYKSSTSKASDSESGYFLVDKRLFVIRRVSVTTDSVQGRQRVHETSGVTLSKFGKVTLPKFPACH